MTPDQLVDKLQGALHSRLKSVVLYGSAVAGDFIPGKSSYNVLIVVDRLGIEELNALSGPIGQWIESRNEPPMLMTVEQLLSSADVFPIELADIRQSRKTLFGVDLLCGIVIHPDDLRLQLERELKGKLLALRRHYLIAQGDSDRIAGLMAKSLSTFLVLFRAALRLFQPEPPTGKLDALQELSKHIAFDPQPFRCVHDLKVTGRLPDGGSAAELFGRYLRAVEAIVDAVDRHIHLKTTGQHNTPREGHSS